MPIRHATAGDFYEDPEEVALRKAGKAPPVWIRIPEFTNEDEVRLRRQFEDGLRKDPRTRIEW